MIYRICINNEDIYGTDLDNSVLNPSLEIELNSAGSLNFTLPPEHRQWDAPNVFVDEVDVYEDNEIIWFGRPLQVTRDWNNQKKVVCEGALAYFNDSVQRPKEYKLKNTTLRQFFEDIIDMHNQQVASNRKIYPGNFTVDDVPVYRKVDYETTAECLQRYCLDTDGGYFILRKERNPEDPSEWLRYIDWVEDLQGRSDQPVQFGLNMLDIAQDLNGADICTVLIPTGGDDLLVNNVATQTVNGCSHVKGEDEIVFVGENDPSNPEGIHKYGRVLKQKDWSDIYDKDQLFQKACEWLVEQNTDIPTIECAAADLHYLPEYEDQYGSDTAKFRVGQKVRVVSSIHGIGSDYVLPMFKISMNLDSGVKRITIGTPPKRELTDIIAPGTSGGSTRSSGSSSGSGGGSSGGSTYVPVVDVLTKVPGSEVYKSVVTKKKAKIDLSELGGGNVVDVTVDGNSVVDPEDNIAKITMPIIPTAPVQDVQVDNQSIVDQNGIANLDSSEFGTTVVANPVESATDDLTTIQIGDTVYDIPGGGGGSGGEKYRQELIYDTPVSTAGNITVSDFHDADSLIFVIGIYVENYGYQVFTNEIPMAEFKTGEDVFIGGTLTTSSGATWSKYARIKYINNTTIQIADIDGHYWSQAGYIYRIYKNIYAASIINNPVYLSDYYSEEEREVGRWTDGKPLYKKTWDLGQEVSFPNNAWTALTAITNIPSIDAIVSHDASQDASMGNQASVNMDVWNDNGTIKVKSLRNDNETIRYLTLRYTKTTDTPGTGPTQGNIIYLPSIYSEEERQIGVDTDGKPLYQRTYKISVDHTSTASYYLQTYAHGISNLNLDSVRFEASIIANSGTVRPLVFNYGTDDYGSAVWNGNVFADNTYILFELGRQIRANTDRIVVTLRYTKTTDTPGSGIWKPDGTLAHHYSFNEHIVGTWVDGSTLWEKTIYDAGGVTGTVSIAHGISNLGTVTSYEGTCIDNFNGVRTPMPFPRIATDNNNIGLANVNSTHATVSITNAFQTRVVDIYVTLRYTKSS